MDPFRLRDKNERNSLAETSARIVLSQFEDPTNLGLWDWNGFESTYHSPLSNDSGKFHASTGHGLFEKNILDRVLVGYLSLSSSLRTGISPNDLPAKLSSLP